MENLLYLTYKNAKICNRKKSEERFVMSFVLSVCGKEYAVMMSDGRVPKYVVNQEAHEDYPKVFQISDKVCVGVTGDPVASFYILKDLQEFDVSKLTLERMKRILTNALKEVPINMMGVKFVISGRNKSNKFTTYVVDSKKDFQEIKYDATQMDQPAVVYFGAQSEKIEEIVDNYIYKTLPWGNIEEAEQQMRACMLAVADVDENVNKKIYQMTVL